MTTLNTKDGMVAATTVSITSQDELFYKEHARGNHRNHIKDQELSNSYSGRAIKTPIACASFVDAAAIIAPKYASTEEFKTETDKCSYNIRSFTVVLPQELPANEYVGLTGDSKTLGEWQLDRCITLKRKNDTLEWSAQVQLENCFNIQYRYFIYAVDHRGLKQIRRWETHLKPRTLSSSVNNLNSVDTIGQLVGGEKQFHRGWLTHDKILQFKFEREKMFQVHDINKFDPENIFLQVKPLTSDLSQPLDIQQTGVQVEVAKLKYGESNLILQPTEGICHKRSEVVIFHITAPLDFEAGFALLFYTKDQQMLGETIIEPWQLQGSSQGDLMLQIKDANETVIARLTLPFLIVKPFSDINLLDFRTTYAHYWPKTWPNLQVGHRGNGKSYIANPPQETENTISSFLKAYEAFADMVELDVHLTADGIPVIYHDFGVRTAPQGKKVSDVSQLEYVLLKDLTYEAIKKLRVFAIINNEIKEFPAHDSEPNFEKRIFPTLEEVLEALPKTLGIDVEIKWPQRKIKGGIEAEQTIDKNYFIDRVLQVILQKGCGRPLIFSSFDADICTMLRYKQNLLPVMYLTQGETKKWEAFLDLRTRTVEQAINNAQAFELAGTAPHAEDFKGEEGAALMKKARDLAQIALVWGDDCNSLEAVEYFQDIGATATCYDRSDLYMPATKTKSFFNSSELMEEFKDQCRS